MSETGAEPEVEEGIEVSGEAREEGEGETGLTASENSGRGPAVVEEGEGRGGEFVGGLVKEGEGEEVGLGFNRGEGRARGGG